MTTRKGRVAEADGAKVDEAQRAEMIREVRRLRGVLAREALEVSEVLIAPAADVDDKVRIARGLVERMLFRDVANLQLVLDGLVQP